MNFKMADVLERGFNSLSNFFSGKHGAFRLGVTAISALTLVQMAMDNGYHISLGNMSILPEPDGDDDYDPEEAIDVTSKDISAEPTF